MTDMVDKLRNIAIVAHGGAGKTSLAEVLLFNSGVISRIGRVEDGNTVMDYEPEELRRNISLSSGFYQYSANQSNSAEPYVISLIDTPGDQDFFSDTKSCMQAADGVVVIIDAVDGVKVQTEQAWDFATEFDMPIIIYVNKMDRERADFFRTYKDAKHCFGDPRPIIIQVPIGQETDFKGVVDLISLKAYTYSSDNGKAVEIDIPPDMKEFVENEHESLVENIAEADDDLLERYLEGEILSDDEIKAALKTGTLSRTFAPVICGSAVKNIGADFLNDFIISCMPSPFDKGPKISKNPDNDDEIICNPDSNEPFAGYVFKTVADPYAGRLSIFKIVSGKLGSDGNFFNVSKQSKERFTQLLQIEGKKQKAINQAGPGSIVAVAKLKDTTTGDTLCSEERKVKFQCAQPLPSLISFAVEAKTKGDEDKIFISLTKLLEEDLALKISRNSETKEILLSGRGHGHIETTAEKLKRKFNVEVQLKTPKVPYKETIKKKVKVQGKHKKQSGGHGQYGDCWISMEPMPRGKGFEFVNAIVGGAIPKTYIPAVEKGIIEASQKGTLAGFPCIDFKVTLNDGTYHAVDSSEMAFKIAGSLAFRKALEEANPILLEPIMKISITTPDEYMGDIMGDLNGKRGRVLGMDNKGKNQVISAHVPMTEFLSYASDLKSMTGGRGMFEMEFSYYDEVPVQIAEKIIEEINSKKE